MDSNTVKRDMLSKQTDPSIPDTVGSIGKAIRQKLDGRETATNTTWLDQAAVNATTDTSSLVSQDVSLVNVLDCNDDHILLIQKEGNGNVFLHVDHHDRIPDPVSQSAEAGIAPINKATNNTGDYQEVHAQQADVASHISGLDVHTLRSILPIKGTLTRPR
jgi:hypothetical protein